MGKKKKDLRFASESDRQDQRSKLESERKKVLEQARLAEEEFRLVDAAKYYELASKLSKDIGDLEFARELKNKAEVLKNRAARIRSKLKVERQRVEVEATAERNRLQLIAEGDAAKIKQDLVAEAEGVLQQIMALKESDERLFQLKLIEAIPGIFQKLPIEKMYVIGDSNSAFGSIAGAVIPFIQVLQDLLRSQKIDLPQIAKKFLDTSNPKS